LPKKTRKKIAVSELGERSEQNARAEPSASAGATYFFRVMGRKEYAQAKDEDLTRELESFTKNINHFMINLNLRREPRKYDNWK
jgi:hypothetical protein